MEERKNLVERILVDRKQLQATEKDVVTTEHIRRYAAIRRFCYGATLDFACGCGYGSYLLAANPHVTSIIGIDGDAASISFAQKEYQSAKLSFKESSPQTINGTFDTLVCLETIEHLEDSSIIPTLVARCKINNVIVSFPDKPTTAYNPYHHHDFVFQEVVTCSLSISRTTQFGSSTVNQSC